MNIVFIVDEVYCFIVGEMLICICENYLIVVWFGFIGMLIFDDNNKGIKIVDLFGNLLYVYFVVDGIFDKNVLGFDV